MTQNDYEDEFNWEEKSKSQVKREMESLQQLGKRLTELNREQFEQVPLDETLAAAIIEYQRLKKNEAKRRQMQYIGKLMRNADADEIEQVINRFDASQAEHTQVFHQIETWRERLLNESNALTQFINQYPDADVQTLRQLIRNAQKEQKQGKNLGGTRKLFQHLREILERDL